MSKVRFLFSTHPSQIMGRCCFKDAVFKRYQKIFSRSFTDHLMELRHSRQVEEVCQSSACSTLYPGECVSSDRLIPGLVKEGNPSMFASEVSVPAKYSSGQASGTEISVAECTGGRFHWLNKARSYEVGLRTQILSLSSVGNYRIGTYQAAFVESRALFEKYLTFVSSKHFTVALTNASLAHDQISGMMQALEHCHRSLVAWTPLISTLQIWKFFYPSGLILSPKQPSNMCDLHPVSEIEDPQETFIDEDGIRIARVLNELPYETEGHSLQPNFKVSIPKQIMKSMPSAPNDFVTPESVQEFIMQVRMVNMDRVNLVNSCIDWLLQSHSGPTSFIGLVCKYGHDCSPCLVQLSVHQRCLLIKVSVRKFLTPSNCPAMLGILLSNNNIIKVGAEIHKDALALFHYLGLVTNRCIKISHLSTGQKRKKEVSAIFRDSFNWCWKEKKKISWSDWESNQITLEQVKYAVLDAWSSRLVWAHQNEMWKGDAPSFSLVNLPCKVLDYFGRSVFIFEEIHRKDKDTAIEMTGAKIAVHRGLLKLQQTNFRSRVLGMNSPVELRFKNGRDPEKYITVVRRGNKVVLDPERASETSINGITPHEIDINVDMISKVFVDNSKNADVQRQKLEDVLYFLLCSPPACPPHILVALGCLRNDNVLKCRLFDLDKSCLDRCKMQLNPSQLDAWKHMLLNPLSAVIGPPGTGKTTLIKAIAMAWDHLANPGETLLCVAHQNVAVRHMAEAMKKEGIPGILLLISEDYYVDWHEEQYEQVKESIVISGPQTAYGMRTWAFRNKMAEPRVILCTLAVIGSESFYTGLMGTKVSFMIIDECSQAAEAHLVSNLVCLPHLQMLSVLGDPSQLPPFGKPLQSVFDLVSGKCDVKFLHEQYRMPYCIAKFVSDEFYQGRLQTIMNIERMKGHSSVAKPILWVNVPGSARVVAGSKSLCNPSEAQAIVKFCMEYKKLQETALTSAGSPSPAEKLIVLTLYEGQRILITKFLKENGLKEIPVYNVDSFQGQEADDVLISLVVGERGSAFAVDRKRACVLLSRAKRLMYVFGNLDSVKTCKNGNDARVDNIWRSLANYCEKHKWVACEEDLDPVVDSLFQGDQCTNFAET